MQEPGAEIPEVESEPSGGEPDFDRSIAVESLFEAYRLCRAHSGDNLHLVTIEAPGLNDPHFKETPTGLPDHLYEKRGLARIIVPSEPGHCLLFLGDQWCLELFKDLSWWIAKRLETLRGDVAGFLKGAGPDTTKHASYLWPHVLWAIAHERRSKPPGLATRWRWSHEVPGGHAPYYDEDLAGLGEPFQNLPQETKRVNFTAFNSNVFDTSFMALEYILAAIPEARQITRRPESPITPKSRRPGANEDRNKFIYEKACEGVDYMKIHDEEGWNPEWEKLARRTSYRDNAHTYAERHKDANGQRLPCPPARQDRTGNGCE